MIYCERELLTIKASGCASSFTTQRSWQVLVISSFEMETDDRFSKMNRSSTNTETYLEEENNRHVSSDYGMLATPNLKFQAISGRKIMTTPQFLTQKLDGNKFPQSTLGSSDINGQAKFATDEVNSYLITLMLTYIQTMTSLTSWNVIMSSLL